MGVPRVPAATRHPTRRAASIATLERWLVRFLPILKRWTHRRLPAHARRRLDTDDLVQEALLAVLTRRPDLDALAPEKLPAYIFQTIRNRIRDEIRRSGKVETSAAGPEPADDSSSPLERAITSEEAASCRAALERLAPEDRALLVGRFEKNLSYAELADRCARPSDDAARVATRRALDRLAQEIAEPRPQRDDDDGS